MDSTKERLIMLYSWKDINEHFKVGDTVYACAYKYNKDKEGRQYFQKPILGKLVLGRTEAEGEFYLRTERKIEPHYFVPFKKNGKDLAWSKVVSIYARYFTTDEEESKEFYNDLIQKQISWHESEIDKLKEDLL